MVTDDGITIRVSACEISEYSRTATGVRVMKPAEGSKVITFTNIGNEDDELEIPEDDGEDIPDDGEPINGENAPENAPAEPEGDGEGEE